MLHDLFILEAGRYLTTFSNPIEFCAVMRCAEGNLIAERNFLRFPLPEDLIDWFEPDANDSLIKLELRAFNEPVLPVQPQLVDTYTKYVEATNDSGNAWRELKNDESFPVTIGNTTFCRAEIPTGMRFLGSSPAYLYAIVAHAPSQ